MRGSFSTVSFCALEKILNRLFVEVERILDESHRAGDLEEALHASDLPDTQTLVFSVLSIENLPPFQEKIWNKIAQSLLLHSEVYRKGYCCYEKDHRYLDDENDEGKVFSIAKAEAEVNSLFLEEKLRGSFSVFRFSYWFIAGFYAAWEEY